jgi:hypothetical protein
MDRGEFFLRSSLAYLATAKNSKNGSCCARCARGGPAAEARGLAACSGSVDRRPWFRLVIAQAEGESFITTGTHILH